MVSNNRTTDFVITKHIITAREDIRGRYARSFLLFMGVHWFGHMYFTIYRCVNFYWPRCGISLVFTSDHTESAGSNAKFVMRSLLKKISKKYQQMLKQVEIYLICVILGKTGLLFKRKKEKHRDRNS